MNLKSQKGSITLFVLVSCLFFLASVVSVNMYMQSKQSAVDKEYRQVKANYEKDINNMETIYKDLSSKNNLTVTYYTNSIIKDEINKKISINVYTNLDYLNIETLKYGWVFNTDEIENLLDYDRLEDIKWVYVEHQNGENEFTATNSYEESGYYYLCTMIDNKIFWMQEPIVIE